MKIIQTTAYEAFDGTQFPNEKECLDYETEAWPKRFVGLTIEEVEAALNRTDKDLAAAFEDAGQRIRALRYEAGDLRRPRKQKDEVDPGVLAAFDIDLADPAQEAAAE